MTFVMSSSLNFICDGNIVTYYRQHDSHEFLSALLDVLSVESASNKGARHCKFLLLSKLWLYIFIGYNSAIFFRSTGDIPAKTSPPWIINPDNTVLSELHLSTPIVQPSGAEPSLTVKKRLLFGPEGNSIDSEEVVEKKRQKVAKEKGSENFTCEAVGADIQALETGSSLCELFTAVVDNEITCSLCRSARRKEVSSLFLQVVF